MPSQCLQISTGQHGEGLYPRNDSEKFKLFGACDFDFDLMTLVCELDLDMAVTNLHDKNEVSRSKGSKVMDTQTDICKTFTYPLKRAVNIEIYILSHPKDRVPTSSNQR